MRGDNARNLPKTWAVFRFFLLAPLVVTCEQRPSRAIRNRLSLSTHRRSYQPLVEAPLGQNAGVELAGADSLSAAEILLPANASTSVINTECKFGPSTDRGSSFPREIQPHEPRRKVTVVFGAFARLRNGGGARLEDIAQIHTIMSSVVATGMLGGEGMPGLVDFHLVVSCGYWGRVSERGAQPAMCTNATAEIARPVISFPRVFVHTYHGNAYEYPALHWLWQLGCADHEGVFLYFHSKGTKYSKVQRHKFRIPTEMMLFREVVAPWRTYSKLFDSNPSLEMAGWFVSLKTFVWHNFFWATGSFLRKLAEPLHPSHVEGDRWYYEKLWLKDMPKDSRLSACPTGPPSFGTVASRGAESHRNHHAQALAFAAFGCSTSSKIGLLVHRHMGIAEKAFVQELKNFDESSVNANHLLFGSL